MSPAEFVIEALSTFQKQLPNNRPGIQGPKSPLLVSCGDCLQILGKLQDTIMLPRDATP